MIGVSDQHTSPTTVEAVLGRMVKEGRIRKIGSGRATRYLPGIDKGFFDERDDRYF